MAIRMGAAKVTAYLDGSALESGLRGAQARLRGFAAGVESLGMKLAGISGLMAAPLIAGGKTFAEFDRQMALVSTMVDEPLKHMEGFTQGVREMSAEFGEGTETLAWGLRELLGSAIAPEHALRVMDVTMKSAIGGFTDARTATNAMINVLNAFHMPATAATEVADMMFQTVRRGVLTFEDLAEYVGNVTATAAAAGMPLDEMGAALATMTRNGLRADVATMALMNTLKEFLKPSKEAAETARQFGMEMSTAYLQQQGILGVMQKLAALPPDVVARIFPNIRGLRGVFALRGDLAGLATDLDLMRSKAGAAEAAFRKVDESLYQSFRRVWQGLKLVQSSIGEALGPALKKRSEDLAKALAGVARWVLEHKDLVVTFMKWTVGIAAAGVALLGIAVAAKTAAMAFGLIRAPIQILSGALKLIGPLLSLISTGLLSMASPLGLVLGAAVALGVGIAIQAGYIGKALDWLKGKFEGLKLDALAAFSGIKDALAAGDVGLAARILWLTLKMEWLRGISVLNEKWEDWKLGFLELGADAFYGLAEALSNGFDEMRRLIVGFKYMFLWHWSEIAHAATGVWEDAVHGWAKIFLGAMSLWDDSITQENFDRLEAEHQERVQGNDADFAADKAQAAADHRADLERIDAEQAAAAESIRKEHAEAVGILRDKRNKDVAAAQAELDAAQKEWQKANMEAWLKATLPDMGPTTPEEAPKKGGFGPNGTRAAMDQVETVGMFNVASLRGLGYGTKVMDRMAKSLEEIAGDTGEIADNTEEGGIAFG